MLSSNLYNDMFAFGAFDSNGNYYCNPSNIGLEEIIYKSALNTLETSIMSYLSLYPNAPTEQVHDYVMKSTTGSPEPTYDIMNKAKTCLESNGVDPYSVATPTAGILRIIAVPEFGPVSIMVVVLGMIGLILINKNQVLKKIQ